MRVEIKKKKKKKKKRPGVPKWYNVQKICKKTFLFPYFGPGPFYTIDVQVTTLRRAYIKAYPPRKEHRRRLAGKRPVLPHINNFQYRGWKATGSILKALLCRLPSGIIYAKDVMYRNPAWFYVIFSGCGARCLKPSKSGRFYPTWRYSVIFPPSFHLTLEYLWYLLEGKCNKISLWKTRRLNIDLCEINNKTTQTQSNSW